MIFPSDPIRDPIRVPKWIGWMDGLSKHLKIRLLTLDFCIVTPGLFLFFQGQYNSQSDHIKLLS